MSHIKRGSMAKKYREKRENVGARKMKKLNNHQNSMGTNGNTLENKAPKNKVQWQNTANKHMHT